MTKKKLTFSQSGEESPQSPLILDVSVKKQKLETTQESEESSEGVSSKLTQTEITGTNFIHDSFLDQEQKTLPKPTALKPASTAAIKDKASNEYQTFNNNDPSRFVYSNNSSFKKYQKPKNDGSQR